MKSRGGKRVFFTLLILSNVGIIQAEESESNDDHPKEKVEIHDLNQQQQDNVLEERQHKFKPLHIMSDGSGNPPKFIEIDENEDDSNIDNVEPDSDSSIGEDSNNEQYNTKHSGSSSEKEEDLDDPFVSNPFVVSNKQKKTQVVDQPDAQPPPPPTIPEEDSNIVTDPNIDSKDAEPGVNSEDSEEPENWVGPIHVTAVKVIKDNVTGDKHDSFSENTATSRDDDKTTADIKREAEERIKEKEKAMQQQQQQQQHDEKEKNPSDFDSHDDVIKGEPATDGEDSLPPFEDGPEIKADGDNQEREVDLMGGKPKEHEDEVDLSGGNHGDSIDDGLEREVNLLGDKVEANLLGNKAGDDLAPDAHLPDSDLGPDAHLPESFFASIDNTDEPVPEEEPLPYDDDNDLFSRKNREKRQQQKKEMLEQLAKDVKTFENGEKIGDGSDDDIDSEDEGKAGSEDDLPLPEEAAEEIPVAKDDIDTSDNSNTKSSNDNSEEETGSRGIRTGSEPEIIRENNKDVDPAQEKFSELPEKVNVIPGEDMYQEALKLSEQAGKKDHRKINKYLSSAADLGHEEAMEKIAYPYLYGDHIARNISRTVEYFELLASKGNPQGQQGLGFLYGSGLGLNSSQARALIYVTFGALGGNVYSQMMLGYRYFSGIGVKQSCESALTYYKKVANKVADDTSSHGGISIQRVRLYDELEGGGTAGQIDEDLLQYYSFLADKGDLQAQVGLGQLYFQGGKGVDVNYEKAFKYFQLAAEAGSGNGLAYLGKMYMEGLHVTQDVDKAYRFFKKASDENNPIGQAGLGTLYLKGLGVSKNNDKAMSYFSQAAEQGYVDGQLQLGNMYYNGIGVSKDYKQAVKYFTFASQSGHILAFYNLANMHATGSGVMRSCHTATELYKNVAERGKWGTMFMDAYDAYKSGDIETALYKYYFLAELGYEVAQSNLAYILDKGEAFVFSENQTYSRALLHWTRAATQGYTVARVKVGDYHFYGLGTKVDYETAALHYRLASDQHNNARAMFNLGYMHEQGFGLKKDIHLAKRFYDMAAEASPDATFPVYLALSKLAMHFTLEWLQKNYKIWEKIEIPAIPNLVDHLGQDWDIYVITTLAGMLGALLLLRRTLRN